MLEKGGCLHFFTDLIPLADGDLTVYQQATRMKLTIDNCIKLRGQITLAFAVRQSVDKQKTRTLYSIQVCNFCVNNGIVTSYILFGMSMVFAMYKKNFDPLTCLLYIVRYLWRMFVIYWASVCCIVFLDIW